MQACTPLPEDHLYMQLIAGLRVLSSKLCVYENYQSSKFSKKYKYKVYITWKNNKTNLNKTVFRKYMKCYQELHDEYLDCVGPTDWTENMEIHDLCKYAYK